MYKLLLFLLINLFSVLDAHSQRVSEIEAKGKAYTFFRMINKTYSRGFVCKQPQLQLAKHRDGLFVFNDEANNGFVVISGDNRLPSVLGYSYEGYFDESNIPYNMQIWLDGYAKQISYLWTHPDACVVSLEKEMGIAISPLLECEWSQGIPYNNKCPQWGGVTCPTGCVATAMAQIIQYYKWPQQTTKTIPGYTTKSNKIEMEDIPITKIDWDNIIPQYDREYTETQADAVATLMLLCGASLKMDYKMGGSGASLETTRNALRDYFDYEEGICLYCDNYELNKWMEILYDELADGHPILYAGDGTPDGHAFIIDGYDDGGYFHMNWGWGGSQNGYFLLSAITPGGYDFSTNQSAIIGARPSLPGSPCAYGVLNNGKMTLYYDIEKGNRSGDIFKNIRSCASDSILTECIIDQSFANYKLWDIKEFFKDSKNLETIKGLEYLNIEDVTSMWRLFDGCKSLKDLDLRNFHTDNITNMGCMFADCASLTTLDLSEFVTSNVTRTDYMFQDCKSLTTIYVGEGWNMDKVNNSWWMFVNDYALKGSKGSRYNYPNYGVEYAHIDGGPDNPGYLSLKTNSYIIYYYVDGELYKSYTINEGNKISPEPEPTVHEGFKFSGWSEIPEYMPNHDLIVTGSFLPSMHTLTYYILEDGKQIPYKEVEIQWGVKIEPEPQPEREGCSFMGWYDLPDVMPDRDISVYGWFVTNQYNILYYVDDELYYTDSYYFGQVIRAIEKPTREGRIFSGWSEIPATMPAHDVVVTGYFSIDGIEKLVETGKPVIIYTLTGTLLYSGIMNDDVLNRLSLGVYIVNGTQIIKTR